MNTDIDWREELDSSFGTGSDHPPTDYLAPGRAALRKRRTAMGAAALATLVVVGGIGWAVAPGDEEARSSKVATDPSPTPSPGVPAESPSPDIAPMADQPGEVRVQEPGDARDFAGPSLPVTVVGNGELVRKADWDIEAFSVLVDRPRYRVWGVSAVPAAGGEAVWMLLDWRPGTSGTTSDAAGKRFAVFEDWLDTTWAEQKAVQAPPVSRTVDGQLALAPGVEALETLDHPAEAAAYGPVDEMVAARLRLTDGTVVFSLIGPDGETTVDPAVLDTPTMDAFLRHLKGQGDNGEGLR